MGEQLEAPVQSSSSSRDENPEFDKEIELLKIQLLSNSAVSMTVSFTAIYLGGWISVAIVALQRIQDLVTLVGVLVITGVIVFRLLV